MHVRTLNATFVLFGLLSVVAFSQNKVPKVTVGGPPSTLTDQLTQYHVELTEAGLIKALQSPDPHVRDLAAARLAEERDMDAVPAIDQALAKEKVTEARINIAFSLALLGEEKGIQELTQDCKDSKLPGYFRARAVAYTLRLDNKACFRAALNLLSNDAGSREQILSLLPQYPHLSKEASEEVLEATTKCLTDDSGAVRIQASMALNALANPSAIPSLQHAIAAEQDDAVRSQMQASLERLQAKGERD